MFIATPCYRGEPQESTKRTATAIHASHGGEWRIVEGLPWVDHARAELVAEFLDTGEAEMLWLDADISFDPRVVDRMLAQTYHVVLCQYRTRKPPHQFVEGLGCCLVRRHAVETLWNAHPELAYMREHTVDKPGRALFTHGVGRASDGMTRMIGEDQAFLDRCRAAGFGVKSLKENICHDGVWNMTQKRIAEKPTVQERVTEPQERIYALPEPAKLALRELLAGQAAAQQRVVDFGRAAALMLGLDPTDPTMRFDAVNGAFVVPGK